jgi:antitoxin ParD1/3/4
MDPGISLTPVDSPRDHATMVTNISSFALPEAMRSHVDPRVRSGQYGNTAEDLRELIEEGLNSGPGQPLTPQRVAQLTKQALGTLR